MSAKAIRRFPVLTFAVERACAAQMNAASSALPGRPAYFRCLPRLDAAHDTIADGGRWTGPGAGPLSLFSAERVDYSLHRLRHYTGTDPATFQSFVLFTNYQRYIDEFTDYALKEIEAGRALRLIEPRIAHHRKKRKEPSRPPFWPRCRKCRPIIWSRKTAKASPW